MSCAVTVVPLRHYLIKQASSNQSKQSDSEHLRWEQIEATQKQQKLAVSKTEIGEQPLDRKKYPSNCWPLSLDRCTLTRFSHHHHEKLINCQTTCWSYIFLSRMCYECSGRDCSLLREKVASVENSTWNYKVVDIIGCWALFFIISQPSMKSNHHHFVHLLLPPVWSN